MTREQTIDEIKAICEKTDNDALKGILNAITASMYIHVEDELFIHVMPFVKEMLSRIEQHKAQQN